MKNFRNLFPSTSRNNLRLFISLSIVALFVVTSLLIWQTPAQMQDIISRNTSVEQLTTNGILLPTLGNYPNTTVIPGADTTVTPTVAPTGTTRINVSTNTNFKGIFAANPTTGVVRITNAHPAGTYIVTVKAFNASGMTTKTFTLTVSNGTICNGTVHFIPKPDVDAGGTPVSVAIGDFNNDGNQDLASANQSSNNVSIRFGNGLGDFTGSTNVIVDNSPRSVVISDFNNDGNQDFATTNFNTNNVSVRLGDGSGNFSNAPNVIVGTSPVGIAVGDFNNDGNKDLAVANFNFNTVSIRLGDGAGNFNGTNEIGVDIVPLSIAIGDFNNDGNQDFVTANLNARTISIRLGDGLGGFSGTTNTNIGSLVNSVVVGDFNNDLNQDLALVTIPSNLVNIRLGDGFGNFNNAGDVSIGANPSSLAISDFNNDGNQDFATANGAIPNTVSIRFGNGLGGFNGTGGVNVDSSPFNIAIGDFNNDGKQDFVTANRGANNLSIRLSTCVTTPTPGNVCTPSTTVTEGDLFPGGIVSFGVTSGAGSVTVDHVNAGTGLQSLTVVSATNAIVNIPPFTLGTQMPVVVTFTPINSGLAVDFTLRAASTFHAANIRARCAQVCTPATTVTEGDLFPGGIVSFGVVSGTGSVTVDHVDAGTGLRSLTVTGTPVNAIVNIPAFTAGTTAPVVVTFTPIDPNQPVDFTLRAASTFHAANVRVRCGTPPPKPERK